MYIKLTWHVKTLDICISVERVYLWSLAIILVYLRCFSLMYFVFYLANIFLHLWRCFSLVYFILQVVLYLWICFSLMHLSFKYILVLMKMRQLCILSCKHFCTYEEVFVGRILPPKYISFNLSTFKSFSLNKFNILRLLVDQLQNSRNVSKNDKVSKGDQSLLNCTKKTPTGLSFILLFLFTFYFP